MLKIGNDHFEATLLEPKVDVCDRRYVFNAHRPPNSPKPLVFKPTDKCPALVVNPKIARQALGKQRADELEYVRLLEDNVPAVPVYSELDGGMNEAFLARFPDRVTLSKKLGLDLAHGGHLTHGFRHNISGKLFDQRTAGARAADHGRRHVPEAVRRTRAKELGVALCECGDAAGAFRNPELDVVAWNQDGIERLKRAVAHGRAPEGRAVASGRCRCRRV